MKKVAILGLLVLTTACGGGGGGDDGVPRECKSYCEFFCQKSANCGFIPQNEVSLCSNTCINKFDSEGTGDSQKCSNAIANVGRMSCGELGRLLGLASLNVSKDLQSGIAVDIGGVCVDLMLGD